MTTRCASGCSGLSSPGCSRSFAHSVDVSPRAHKSSPCPLGVKTGKAQCEQMFSALPPRADIAQRSRHVRFVTEAEVIFGRFCRRSVGGGLILSWKSVCAVGMIRPWAVSIAARPADDILHGLHINGSSAKGNAMVPPGAIPEAPYHDRACQGDPRHVSGGLNTCLAPYRASDHTPHPARAP
jgi:hypothetical protein